MQRDSKKSVIIRGASDHAAIYGARNNESIRWAALLLCPYHTSELHHTRPYLSKLRPRACDWIPFFLLSRAPPKALAISRPMGRKEVSAIIKANDRSAIHTDSHETLTTPKSCNRTQLTKRKLKLLLCFHTINITKGHLWSVQLANCGILTPDSTITDDF